jgi:hypothetical protein
MPRPAFGREFLGRGRLNLWVFKAGPARVPRANFRKIPKTFFEQPCARLRPRPFRSSSRLELHGSFRWQKASRGATARRRASCPDPKIRLTALARLTPPPCVKALTRTGLTARRCNLPCRHQAGDQTGWSTGRILHEDAQVSVRIGCRLRPPPQALGDKQRSEPSSTCPPTRCVTWPTLCVTTSDSLRSFCRTRRCR